MVCSHSPTPTLPHSHSPPLPLSPTPTLPHSHSPPMNDINPAFLLLIPLAWCCISFAMSRLSGWVRLAQQYPATTEATGGEVARMRTGRIGVINYYSCLTFRATEEGLHIAVTPLLRLGHPPMFIPWDEFHHISNDPILYSQKVRMSVGKPTVNRFVFPGWVKYRLPFERRPSS